MRKNGTTYLLHSMFVAGPQHAWSVFKYSDKSKTPFMFQVRVALSVWCSIVEDTIRYNKYNKKDRREK